MHLVTSQGLPDALQGKIALLDNDFLSVISKDTEAFTDFVTLVNGRCALVIDPLTRFEFLHGVTFVDRKEALETFLTHEIFTSGIMHPSVFNPIVSNAEKLSWVYANKNCTSGSPIDLLLASRAIFQGYLIITGNRKDFPNFVFDRVGIINYEELNKEKTTVNVRGYSVLEYNRTSYDTAVVEAETSRKK